MAFLYGIFVWLPIKSPINDQKDHWWQHHIKWSIITIYTILTWSFSSTFTHLWKWSFALGTRKMQVMFLNDKTRAAYETFRRSSVRHGSFHCVKSALIRSFSGPCSISLYLVRMLEKRTRKCGHFSRSVYRKLNATLVRLYTKSNL